MNQIGLYFIDGLPFHLLQKNQRLREELESVCPYIKPLRSSLGYSFGIHPSIWSSSLPSKHGKFVEWKLNQDFIPRRINLRLTTWKLQIMANYVVSRSQRKSIHRVMPRELFECFVEESHDSEPTDLGVPTLFDIIHEKSKRNSLTHRDFDEIDCIAHRKGIMSEIYNTAVSDVLKKISKEAKNQDLTLIFSDHGTSDIKKRINLLKILNECKPVLGKDYLYFLDSTMCRFWFFNSNSKAPIIERLRPFGHFVTEDEKKNWGLSFQTNEYFDEVLVVQQGVEIYPNFFHPVYPNYIKAVHGYHPAESEAYGIIASSQQINSTAPSILDIAPSVLKALDINQPDDWVGKAVL